MAGFVSSVSVPPTPSPPSGAVARTGFHAGTGRQRHTDTAMQAHRSTCAQLQSLPHMCMRASADAHVSTIGRTDGRTDGWMH
eukprot:7009553-Alexandrium_andersonii.AAC.1